MMQAMKVAYQTRTIRRADSAKETIAFTLVPAG